MTQPTLEDALAARDEAVDRAEGNANTEWKNAARLIVERLALLREEFTTDDVHEYLSSLDVTTHEPRALGAIIKSATADGWIEPTGDYVKSRRPKCHARPIPVYRSLRRLAA